jgi:hypothetical protein
MLLSDAAEMFLAEQSGGRGSAPAGRVPALPVVQNFINADPEVSEISPFELFCFLFNSIQAGVHSDDTLLELAGLRDFLNWVSPRGYP